MNLQRTHELLARAALVGLGSVIGMIAVLASEALVFALIALTVLLAIAAGGTAPDRDEDGTVKVRLGKRELDEHTAAMIRQAEEEAAERLQDADEQAQAIEAAAHERAREIIERARTSAAAIDPAVQPERRVRPRDA